MNFSVSLKCQMTEVLVKRVINGILARLIVNVTKQVKWTNTWIIKYASAKKTFNW